jgi:hypothetical protein
VPRIALGHVKSLCYVRVLRENTKEKSRKKFDAIFHDEKTTG